MNVVDILISIVVVTILVTIILAVVTYVAYKLRLSREPNRMDDDDSDLRYFVRYDPPESYEEPDGDSSLNRLEQDVAGLEGHAAEA
jgi:hypothetical protein